MSKVLGLQSEDAPQPVASAWSNCRNGLLLGSSGRSNATAFAEALEGNWGYGDCIKQSHRRLWNGYAVKYPPLVCGSDLSAKTREGEFNGKAFRGVGRPWRSKCLEREAQMAECGQQFAPIDWRDASGLSH